MESTSGNRGWSGQVLGRVVVNCAWTNEVLITSGVEGIVWNGDIDELFASAGNINAGVLGKGTCTFNGTIQEFTGSDGGDVYLAHCKFINVPTTMSGSLTVETLGDHSAIFHDLGGTGSYHIKNVTGVEMWFEKPSSANVYFYSHVKGGANVNIDPLTIASGLVVFYNGFTFGDTSPNTNPGAIVLSGGTLDLVNGTCEVLGSIIVLNQLAADSVVTKTGGTLIIRNATLKTGSSDTPVIIATTTAQDILVQGTMLSNRTENGGTLAAKSQQEKYTVDSIATTSITLDDGSGPAEVFTESDTGTFDSEAKLAEQMAVLINASGSLALTASQTTPGTDTFFFVTADVAGTAFTKDADTNLSDLVVRLNSFALTDKVGGTIIEDADVQ